MKKMTTTTTKKIICKLVNYQDPNQGAILTKLLNAYAMDPLGGCTPLNQDVMEHLPSRLAKIPHAFSFIAYANTVSEDDEIPVGLVNCFEGFSTFAARPLVNIHDMYVVNEFRGHGVSQALLAAVEKEACSERRGNCCKITLECLSKNEIALKAYKKSGFDSYELNPEHGVAMFLEKKLEYE